MTPGIAVGRNRPEGGVPAVCMQNGLLRRALQADLASRRDPCDRPPVHCRWRLCAWARCACDPHSGRRTPRPAARGHDRYPQDRVRADQEGIIFGPHPVLLAPGSRFSRVSVPWKDIDKISLYKEPVKGDGSGGKFIGTVPRQPSDAAAEHSLWLAYCPLDLECLAAVTASAARALPSSTPVTPMPIRMLGLDAVGAS